MDFELIQYCEENNIEYHILDEEEEETIRNNITEKYIDKNKKNMNFFDDMLIEHEVGIGYIAGSWRWIRDYIENKEVIMFNAHWEGNSIKLYDGSVFIDYYETTMLDEFYITNENTDFLLSYNDSCCLWAFGEAGAWLKSTTLYKYWQEAQNVYCEYTK